MEMETTSKEKNLLNNQNYIISKTNKMNKILYEDWNLDYYEEDYSMNIIKNFVISILLTAFLFIITFIITIKSQLDINHIQIFFIYLWILECIYFYIKYSLRRYILFKRRIKNYNIIFDNYKINNYKIIKIK